jgi:antitoxin MazE
VPGEKEDTMVVQVNRWGHSLAIRLPRTIAAEAGITHGATVEMRSAGRGKITITRIEETPVYQLEELLRGVTPENRHPIIEPSGPVGQEVW